jgi:hypothetical protein
MALINHYDNHHNYHLSDYVSKAIDQRYHYLDILHSVAAKSLLDHSETAAYHLKGIIVIGQSKGRSEEKLVALHALNRRLPGISIMTYDHLLAQGEQFIKVLDTRPGDNDFEPFCDDEYVPLFLKLHNLLQFPKAYRKNAVRDYRQ